MAYLARFSLHLSSLSLHRLRQCLSYDRLATDFEQSVQRIFSLLSLDNKSLILSVRRSTQFLRVSFLNTLSSFVIFPLTSLLRTGDILRLGPPFPRPLLDIDVDRDVEGLSPGGEVAEEDNDVGEAERDVVGRDCTGDVFAGEDDLGVGDRGGDDSRHGNILCPVRGSYLEKSYFSIK